MRYYAGILGLLCALAGTVMADVYKCSDSAGKVLYQNTPCNDTAAPVLTTPTLSTPPPDLPAHAAAAPAAVAPAAAPVATPVSAASTADSRPVDTHQLGLIQLGMGKAEVQRRLGPPVSIDTSDYEVGQGVRKVQIHEERWTYPGTSSAPPAIVVFKNGEVESRGREGQETRRSIGDVIHRR
jgi:Protein of unknown function (DUF2845)